MNLQEFQTIKDKIKQKEISNATATGKMASIEESWKNRYGISTLSEAEKKLAELKKESEEKEKTRDEYFKKLQSLVDWETV
jgi:hypothetical protein